MSIHSGSSALDRVYWGRDLLGFPRCWLLHGGSAGCWCTCGSKCKGTIEPERKMPLFSLCFCSTLALADDSFQSMFLSAAVPAVSAFLLRCPHQRHQGSLPYARCPLYSDIPFPITELEEVLGMVWDRVGWPGLLWLWYSITPEVIIWEYPQPPLQCELVYAGVKSLWVQGRGFGLFPAGTLGPDWVDGVVPAAKTFSCQGELAACIISPWET